MKRLKIVLSFDGTGLHGFQVQAKQKSVQGELNRAFEVLCKEPVKICGCSRTDAGVHARVFICHADVPDGLNEKTLVKSLNALLPDSIGVLSVSAAKADYHARYSVISKTYRYYFWNAQSRNPLLKDRAAQVRFPLDLDRMKQEAKALCGSHDFKNFQSAGGKELLSTVRTVTRCKLHTEHFPLCCFEITADGFLYHMVRNLMGALIQIGRGKEPRGIKELLAASPKPALNCAPACGLYLWEVEDQEN